MATEQTVPTDQSSAVARGGKVIAGFVLLMVVNLFAVAFAAGYFAGMAGESNVIVFGAIAAAIFVAPFNYVIFERLVDAYW